MRAVVANVRHGEIVQGASTITQQVVKQLLLSSERSLERLRRNLLPGGVPQERKLNFLTYRLKYGPEPLERLLSLEPSGAHFLDI